MTRIVAGRAKGFRLAVPAGNGTRPTSDRAREALFSALHAQLGELAGLSFLDLYAGSGAVGLEALSRGAARALFVESDARAVAVLRANVEKLGLPGAEIRAGKLPARLSTPPEQPFDLAFLDPPYAEPTTRVTAVLEALTGGGWLAPDALVVVERSARDKPWQWPVGWEAQGDRRYGEAALWYGRAS